MEEIIQIPKIINIYVHDPIYIEDAISIDPIKITAVKTFFEVKSFVPLSLANKVFIGADPGQVNTGLVVLYSDAYLFKGKAYQIKFPNSSSMERRITVFSLFSKWLLKEFSYHQRALCACIENAAYGAPFGQAALAENRTLLAHLLITKMANRLISPAPTQIRKTIFGKGSIKAENVWPEFEVKYDGKGAKHLDCASALACALYAKLTVEQEVNDGAVT